MLYKRSSRPFSVAIIIASLTAAAQTKPSLATDCSAYSAISLPAEAERGPVPKVSPACASYRSYRGIGRPLNYSEARTCAWKERLAQKADLGQNKKEPIAWVVGGSLILADIYYNGAGVKQDIPLAIRFACEFEEGTVKLALRDIVKSSAKTHRPFEFCEYAMSTFTMNFCSSYGSEVKKERRARLYDQIRSTMTQEQAAAFKKLLIAKTAYINAHASEVNQEGTIRALRTIGSQDLLEDSFHSEIVHFERKRWPSLSDSQITRADDLLAFEYDKKLRQLQRQSKNEIEQGAVTAEHLSQVQRSWETYRDAWVAFAQLRYPARVKLIHADITRRRYQLLRSIPEE